MSAQPLHLFEDPRLAARALHPTRLRILEALREPGSASSLARQFGLPRQRVRYHLHELEKQGLVEAVEERRRGNCVERVVRARASHYLVNPEALGSLAADPSQIADRFSSTYLVAVASQTIREVASLRARAAAAGKPLATLTLHFDIRFASAAQRNAFALEVSQEMDRLVAKYHDEKTPGGRTFRFSFTGYPASTPTPPQGPVEASKFSVESAAARPRRKDHK